MSEANKYDTGLHRGVANFAYMKECCCCHNDDHQVCEPRHEAPASPTCGCGCSCQEGREPAGWRDYAAPIFSFLLLAAGMIMNHLGVAFFTANGWVQPVWYLVAFLPVAVPALGEALEAFKKRDIFNEFTLMLIACIGVFCIGEYPEGVGVMLFYSVGEMLQERAVRRATGDISALVDRREKHVTVIRDGQRVKMDPDDVRPGDVIEVKPGESVPLDGLMESETAVFDTSALTGESMPRTIERGGEVLSGMISSDSAVRLRVTREYDDSTLSKILQMVKEASERKASTELFIRRFARVYTPVVLLLALLIVAVPALVGAVSPDFRFIFSEWLERALVFLVVSCPCALVVSVPLAYFVGIGAASRRGVLCKGGQTLDSLAAVNMVAFDKTGTLTTGRFHLEKVKAEGIDEESLLAMMAAVETASNHPLAVALMEAARERGLKIEEATDVKETPGYGLTAVVAGHTIAVGNLKLLDRAGIAYREEAADMAGSKIACAIDGRYAGCVVVADTLKEDSQQTMADLRKMGINRLVMLSGDNATIVGEMGRKLGLSEAHGDMLPQQKAQYVEEMAASPEVRVAFVGDGINDAPVLALSNVGIAMGALGSDAAIESADVVIHTDAPSRVSTAIGIARKSRRIIIENIVGAIGIKLAVIVLGALGIATLWGAVFADVGVTLLAVLNCLRIRLR